MVLKMSTQFLVPGAGVLKSGWRNRSIQLIESLPEFLTWNSGSDLLKRTSDFYETWIDRRLYLWEERVGMGQIDRIRALPLSHQRRLRSAPHFFLLLRSKRVPSDDDLAKMTGFIEVEEYLAGMRQEIAPHCWSALGDYCSDSGTREITSPSVRNIVVDLQSSNRHEVLRLEDKVYGDHDPEEQSAILEQLDRGFFVVESTNLTALEMIDSMVSVIMPVKNPTELNGSGSISQRRLIGAMAIVNLVPNWHAVGIADSLVHEAIHSLIYRMELFFFLHTDDDASLLLKTSSPWTGRELPMRSFVHACFVWFGLWNFWKLCSTPGKNVTKHRTVAQAGFLKGPLEALITNECAENLQPYVKKTISRMFDLVRSESLPA